MTDRLFRPVDARALAFFRAAFGGLLVLECLGAILIGWVREVYIDPTVHFTYVRWLAPLPGVGMYLLYLTLAALAGAVSLGWRYRAAAPLLAAGLTYAFLLEKAYYINHHYLCVLYAWLLCFLPADAALSLDARRRPAAAARATVPAWTVGLLAFQMGVVYFFGGIAKLNSDWLRGQPVRGWLLAKVDYPVVGPLLGLEPTAWLVAYGGLAFDLLIVPAMLWRRTRAVAFGVCLLFHLGNQILFQVGIFSFLALAATLLFFDPDALAARLFGSRGPPARSDGTASLDAPTRSDAPARSDTPAPAPPPSARRRRVTLALLAAYALVQVLLPLRHHAIAGRVDWTEEGHRFAWRMMLRHKQGSAWFIVRDPSDGRQWTVVPDQHLTPEQAHVMVGQPDMIVHYARWLEARYAAERDIADPEVRAIVQVSLNGRVPQLLIDPAVDLTRAETPAFAHAAWIRPLTEPLPPWR